jgi:hypothetical protein
MLPTLHCSVGAIVSVGLASLTLACGGGPDAMNARSIQDIRSRAAFETHCDASAFKFTPLVTEPPDEGGYVSQYGVEGCGKRLVYVHQYGGDWVLNTASDSDAKSAAK